MGVTSRSALLCVLDLRPKTAPYIWNQHWALESARLRIGCRVTHNLTPECGLVLPRSVSIKTSQNGYSQEMGLSETYFVRVPTVFCNLLKIGHYEHQVMSRNARLIAHAKTEYERSLLKKLRDCGSRSLSKSSVKPGT